MKNILILLLILFTNNKAFADWGFSFSKTSNYTFYNLLIRAIGDNISASHLIDEFENTQKDPSLYTFEGEIARLNYWDKIIVLGKDNQLFELGAYNFIKNYKFEDVNKYETILKMNLEYLNSLYSENPEHQKVGLYRHLNLDVHSDTEIEPQILIKYKLLLTLIKLFDSMEKLGEIDIAYLCDNSDKIDPKYYDQIRKLIEEITPGLSKELKLRIQNSVFLETPNNNIQVKDIISLKPEDFIKEFVFKKRTDIRAENIIDYMFFQRGIINVEQGNIIRAYLGTTIYNEFLLIEQAQEKLSFLQKIFPEEVGVLTISTIFIKEQFENIINVFKGQPSYLNEFETKRWYVIHSEKFFDITSNFILYLRVLLDIEEISTIKHNPNTKQTHIFELTGKISINPSAGFSTEDINILKSKLDLIIKNTVKNDFILPKTHLELLMIEAFYSNVYEEHKTFFEEQLGEDVCSEIYTKIINKGIEQISRTSLGQAIAFRSNKVAELGTIFTQNLIGAASITENNFSNEVDILLNIKNPHLFSKRAIILLSNNNVNLNIFEIEAIFNRVTEDIKGNSDTVDLDFGIGLALLKRVEKMVEPNKDKIPAFMKNFSERVLALKTSEEKELEPFKRLSKEITGKIKAVKDIKEKIKGL